MSVIPIERQSVQRKVAGIYRTVLADALPKRRMQNGVQMVNRLSLKPWTFGMMRIGRSFYLVLKTRKKNKAYNRGEGIDV